MRSINSTIAYFILIAVFLYGIGLVMVFNTSSAAVLDSGVNRNLYIPLFKQVIFGVGGFFGGWSLYKLGYKRVFGMTANGAKRWITLLGISMQPSEFVKYIIPLFFIHEVLKYGQEITLKEFLPILGKIAIPLFLILIEPDNRTTIMIGGTLVVLFSMCSIPKRFWVTPLIIGLLGVGFFASTRPYVAARINVYINPELDLRGKGHQPYQSKIALGSGGWTGKGIGQSLQKLSYLPEAQNDYIVAILGEEMGFLGIFVIIICYMSLTLLGIKIAFFTEDKAGSYVAMAMIVLISLQAFINFGVVSGLLPTTGLNLPLFSQGGSSLIVNSCVIGLILSICPKKSLLQ
ncbi:MAG: putative peptidoglycan glycosyltransferase FtsW [Chlamydiae bacterium]|nr:putative peptidoglycan glycosyltransferase FtsW [Chlamydiota bacterium]